MKLLYPDVYLSSVREITKELLDENDVKGLILDIDNTLIDYDKVLPQDIIKWCKELKEKGIRMCILSNTNKVKKVERVAKELDLEYIYFAHKPNKRGFIKAKKLLDLENKNIAVVGDQVFTDVLGGRMQKMFTILTVPLDERDIFITKLKRPFERLITKKLKIYK